MRVHSAWNTRHHTMPEISFSLYPSAEEGAYSKFYQVFSRLSSLILINGKTLLYLLNPYYSLDSFRCREAGGRIVIIYPEQA